MCTRAGSVANLWIEPGELLRGAVPEHAMAEQSGPRRATTRL